MYLSLIAVFIGCTSALLKVWFSLEGFSEVLSQINDDGNDHEDDNGPNYAVLESTIKFNDLCKTKVKNSKIFYSHYWMSSMHIINFQTAIFYFVFVFSNFCFLF